MAGQSPPDTRCYRASTLFTTVVRLTFPSRFSALKTHTAAGATGPPPPASWDADRRATLQLRAFLRPSDGLATVRSPSTYTRVLCDETRILYDLRLYWTRERRHQGNQFRWKDKQVSSRMCVCIFAVIFLIDDSVSTTETKIRRFLYHERHHHSVELVTPTVGLDCIRWHFRARKKVFSFPLMPRNILSGGRWGPQRK